MYVHVFILSHFSHVQPFVTLWTCNAGDPNSIPGSGRSPGEGTGHLLQCSWASLWLSW